MNSINSEKRNSVGVWICIGAYFIWGILPIYWILLESLSAPDILCYRFIWTVGFLIVLFAVKKDWRRNFYAEARAIFSKPRQVLYLISASLLLASNWLTFIWVVMVGRTSEASLGYFINPLFNILLAYIFLKERLSKTGIAACLFALVGVAVITIHEGALPWPSLVLAGTFGIYGLFKKKLTLKAYTSLSLEMLPMLPFTFIYLFFFSSAGFMGNGLWVDLTAVGCGILTAVPLLLFGEAARRISYISIGFIQYLCPTMYLVIAIFIFHEPLSMFRLLGFIFIWVGVIVFTAGAVAENRTHKV